MEIAEKIIYIVNWLKEQLLLSKQKGFVVGVSGGIDSAVVSTLCAMTGKPVILLSMPIYQASNQLSRAENHLNFLKSKYKNVQTYTIDLSESFEKITETLPEKAKRELSLANTRSRLRMLTLYAFANSNNYLVAGTGNKIEDFGVGFFTKYGDGGVDISPVADLYKSEVYEMGQKIGVSQEILQAPPTDGLWENDKTDEQQIGASYDELEWAMKFCNGNEDKIKTEEQSGLSLRQIEVLNIYLKRHFANKHKMQMPKVCVIPK